MLVGVLSVLITIAVLVILWVTVEGTQPGTLGDAIFRWYYTRKPRSRAKK